MRKSDHLLPKRKVDLRRYRDHLEHAQKWRSDEGYDATWARMVDLYRGRQFDQESALRDKVSVNLAYSSINVIEPSVAVNFPKITVSTRQAGGEGAAEVTEAMLNYWWKVYDYRAPIRRAVKDSLIIGHGWTKVGWKYAQKKVELTDEELDFEIARRIAEADLMVEARPEMAGQLPSDEEIAAQVERHHYETLEDRPTVERISPFDMFVSPEATSMDDARWIAQRYWLPLDEVRSRKQFSQTARKHVKPTLSFGTQSAHGDKQRQRSEEERRDSDATDWVGMWEFYDLDEGKFAVWAEGSGDFLIRPKDMPYHLGHPFEKLGNHAVPDQFYEIGEIEATETLQQELNQTRSQMVQNRRRDQRKYLAKLDHLSVEGRAALVSDKDNDVVAVDADVDLNDVVRPLQFQPMSQEVWMMSEQITEDINSVTGISEYARGLSPSIRKTATEAAMIQDAQNARASDKLDMVERFIANNARKVLQLAQQFVSPETAIPIAGPEAAQQWMELDRAAIQGEFFFEVEAGSTQPNNEAFKRQEAMTMVQALAPFVQMGILDPNAVAEHILRDGFGVRDPGKFMVSQEQQAAQQQAAMMAGGDPAAAGGPPPMPNPGAPQGADAPQDPPIPGVDTSTQLQNQMGMAFGQ